MRTQPWLWMSAGLWGSAWTLLGVGFFLAAITRSSDQEIRVLILCCLGVGCLFAGGAALWAATILSLLREIADELKDGGRRGGLP